jgi:hypothetical protein
MLSQKLFKKKISVLKVMERNRQTDGQMEAIPMIPFPLCGRGLKYALCTDMLVLLNLHLSEINT